MTENSNLPPNTANQKNGSGGETFAYDWIANLLAVVDRLLPDETQSPIIKECALMHNCDNREVKRRIWAGQCVFLFYS
jgi:hypothetical protein